MSLDCLWTEFHHIESSTKAGSVKKWSSDHDFLWKWLKLVGNKVPGYEVPATDNHEAILACLTRNSPELRAFLLMVADQVVRDEEKILVWCTYPAAQFFVWGCLRLLKTDARLFTAELKPKDRENTSDDFTKERKKCMALVASYSVGSLGLNWQPLCHRVHLIEPHSSEPAGVQAIGCVRRSGNPSEVVYVYEYYGKDTFNDRLVQLNIRKVLPSIMTELDRRTFSSETTESSAAPRDDDEVEIDLGRWVLHKDRLERESELDPNSRFLTPEELLAAIVRPMKGERITIA